MIFCGQCGTENPEFNNYCHKCGSKLTHLIDNQNLLNQKRINEDNYSDLIDALKRLLKTNGFLIVSIGDYYIQLVNKIEENCIMINAVSSYYLPNIGNKDVEFNELGYSSQPKENYIKEIEKNQVSEDKLVKEIKIIFESIYGLDFSGYEIQMEYDDLEDNQDSQISNIGSSSRNRKNNNVYWLIFVFIIIAIIYNITNEDEDKSYLIKAETVQNNEYDGSVFQVQYYLKNNYLRDPKSYEGIDWSKVQVNFNDPIYKYHVRHKFRAKNGFGGYTIEEKNFYLDENGDVVKITD